MDLIAKYGLDSQEREHRKRFVRLTREDVEALRALRPWLEKHVDQIVEGFYGHLLQYAETKRFFPDEKTLGKVKALQREYLLDLTSGQYDEGYFARRLQIGVVTSASGSHPSGTSGATQSSRNCSLAQSRGNTFSGGAGSSRP